MISLQIGQLVELNGRIFRVADSSWKNGTKQGRKAILKLVREKELMKLLLNKEKEIPNPEEIINFATEKDGLIEWKDEKGEVPKGL